MTKPNDYEINSVLDRDAKKMCSNNKMCKHLLSITDKLQVKITVHDG